MSHHGVALHRQIAGSAQPAAPADALAAFDPRARILVALIGAVAAVALSSYAGLAVAMVFALAAVAAARPCLRTLRQRLLALEGFMVMILATLPFTVPTSGPNEVLFSLGPFTAGSPGLHQALAILLKTNIVVLVLAAMLGRMEPMEFGRGLAGLGFPRKLVTLLLLTIRYLDVLRRDYRRLRRSMQVRGFRARADRHSLRSLGYLVGMLLIRSFDRSERVLSAMRCRGFTGTFRHDALATPGWRDAGLAVTGGLAILVCVWVEVRAG